MSARDTCRVPEGSLVEMRAGEAGRGALGCPDSPVFLCQGQGE